MNPRPTTDADLAYWGEYDPQPTVIGGPPSEPDCIPCPAIITTTPGVLTGTDKAVRVPYVLDEIEVMHLAKGGTLWLTTWGGLPIHFLEVQEPVGQSGMRAYTPHSGPQQSDARVSDAPATQWPESGT